MRHNLANTPQRGLSLIELLITISIAVILLTVGVPSFIDMIASNTATSYANDLLGDINYARSEAITRGVRVTVCHSNDSATCSGTWSNGWIVFANMDTAGTQDAVDVNHAVKDEILRVHVAVNTASGWALNANTNFTNFVAFLPDGRSNQKGTFVFCKDDVLRSGNQSRSSAVTINQTGRARVLQDTDGDGNPNATAVLNLSSCTSNTDDAW